MATDVGYCTVDDVRLALRKSDLPGDAVQDRDIVVNAITAQTEWVQETTNRHWFDVHEDATVYGEGIYGDGVYATGQYVDEIELLPEEPLKHSMDELDIPSSPHAGHTQAFRGGRGQARYPARYAGPYTRVKLTRRDVIRLNELLIRDNAGGVTDWVDEKTEGRGEDYYVQTNDHDGFSYLYLHTGSLPRLRDYGNSVIATYQYGIEGITQTVRRATALRAAAHLTDKAAIQIPDNARLTNVETLADEMRQRAEELLSIHV